MHLYERVEKANLVALCLARGDDVERLFFFFFANLTVQNPYNSKIRFRWYESAKVSLKINTRGSDGGCSVLYIGIIFCFYQLLNVIRRCVRLI